VLSDDVTVLLAIVNVGTGFAGYQPRRRRRRQVWTSGDEVADDGAEATGAVVAADSRQVICFMASLGQSARATRALAARRRTHGWDELLNDADQSLEEEGVAGEGGFVEVKL